MDLFLAAYLTLFDPSAAERMDDLPVYYHTISADSSTSASCGTGWGEQYQIGQSMTVDTVEFTCRYMSTWLNGEYVGDSARWQLTSVVH